LGAHSGLQVGHRAGEPVLAKDVVVSLNRWAARDPVGRMIKAIENELSPLDDHTFRWMGFGEAGFGAVMAGECDMPSKESNSNENLLLLLLAGKIR
jgi:hypothetical protein